MSGSMDVTAKLIGDNASFDNAQKTSAAVATATGNAIEKASKKAASAQAFAAKFAADTVSEQSLKIVAAQKMESAASSEYRKVLQFNKAGLLDEVQGSQAAAAALQRLTAARMASAAAAKVEGEETRAAYISQQMAASGAIRIAAGQDSIRAVERFITTIPGVGAALQNIFPIIGAAAFAAIIVEMGTKLYDMWEKAKGAGKAIGDAFDVLNDKAETSNDKLALTNSRLEDQIARISGHPTNGLQTSLLEAKVAADELLASLGADVKAVQELMKQNESSELIGMFTSTASGKGANKDVTDQLAKLQDDTAKQKDQLDIRLLSAQQAHAKAIAEAKGSNAAISAADNAFRAAQLSAQAAFNDKSAALAGQFAATMRKNATDIATIQKGDPNDLTALRSPYEKAAELGDRIQRRIELSAQNETDESTLGSVKQNKSGSDKAAEERMRQFESELAQMKIDGNVSAKAEMDFWQERIGAFKAGSSEYLEVQRHEAELAVAGARAAHEAIQKFQRTQDEQSRGTGADAALRAIEENQRKINEAMSQQDKARDSRADAANELDAVKQRNAASLEELQISEASGRSITRQAAAMQLAAVHTAAFGAEITRLNAKAQEIANASYLTDSQKATQLGKIQIDASNMQTSRSEQVMKDNNAIGIPDSSAMVGAKDALDAFTNSANDAARMMQEIVSSTLSDVNKSLLADMTGKYKPGQWKSTGSAVFTSVAGGLLKKGEGSLFSSLGFGSSHAPKGTAGDPMHVIIANMPMSGANGMTMSPEALGQLMGDPSSGAKSPAGGLVTKLLPMIPGFADGGAYTAGTLAMVGEQGPELVQFGSNAHITPNNKLNSIGGGHTFNIDARGSTDPAQTKALVRQGIMEAAPHISAATMKAMDSRNSRVAPSARR